MEDIRTATRLLNKDFYMVNLDLKEAYFLLPIHSEHTKFLRFYFNEDLYEFTALPFGLCSAPYIFTKILQPVASWLRSQGYLSVRYLDDILCIGKSYNECLENVNKTVECLSKLGFIINYKKSNLTPSKSCTFLGFVLNSDSMCLQLPEEKRIKIFHKIELMMSNVSRKKMITIRDFARFIGTLTSVCPAIPYGWLYTKSFERAKYLALLKSGDDYDRLIEISQNLNEDLRWWKNHILTSSNPIRQHNYQLEIFTDASTTGWGAACDGEKTGGLWSESERNFHINYLELLAVYLGLQTYAKYHKNCDILLRVDNTTAISYVNRMGGIQYPHLTYMTKLIWTWCEQRNIFIFASYVKSSQNFEADSESRKLNIDTEWELSSKIFSQIIIAFGTPDIDLFASRINAKCKKYISWKKDPYAFNIDAFTIDWSSFFFYAFPPFALILKVLNKIVADRATGIVVVPQWPSQAWYPLYKSLCIKEVIVFAPEKYLVSSTFRTVHPLHRHLSLAVSVLSGRDL